jgi:hypothetical protein
MISTVKVLYFTGKLCFEKGSVEMGNWAGAGHAVNGVLPRCLNIVTDGSKGAQAGYYYSFKFHLSIMVKTQCALGRIVVVIEADASSAEGEIYSRME